MRLYIKKKIILFAFVASGVSWVAIYMGLLWATNSFFKNYPAPASDQSEAIGIVLNEIAPMGCLMSSIAITALSLVWKVKVSRDVVEAEFLRYLSRLDSPEALALQGEIMARKDEYLVGTETDLNR